MLGLFRGPGLLIDTCDPEEVRAFTMTVFFQGSYGRTFHCSCDTKKLMTVKQGDSTMYNIGSGLSISYFSVRVWRYRLVRKGDFRRALLLR